MNHPLTQLHARIDDLPVGGRYAVCSAHPLVLRCAMHLAVKTRGDLLVEATANQVNADGGYTGMTPTGFAEMVAQLAHQTALPRSRIFLGADHLGPHVWKTLPLDEAMGRAEQLARQCVEAGFCKIHLDTVTGQLIARQDFQILETAARNAAKLCRAAEEAAGRRPNPENLFYVIGTDVPPPGGGLVKDGTVAITRPDQLVQTLDLFERAFRTAGLHAAWQRVMAVVVQPGVEFGDRDIADYNSPRARELSAFHSCLPGFMTFEIHAADFQSGAALRRLVRDRFNLIKVGPCLTFALRDALYALSHIEQALPDVDRPAELMRIMEEEMTTTPCHWRSHYMGSPEELRFLRHYSLRDRIRYYWAQPRVDRAVNQLLRNLRRRVPGTLLHQFLPDLFPEARTPARLFFDPQRVVAQRIEKALLPYVSACEQGAAGEKPDDFGRESRQPG